MDLVEGREQQGLPLIAANKIRAIQQFQFHVEIYKRFILQALEKLTQLNDPQGREPIAFLDEHVLRSVRIPGDLCYDMIFGQWRTGVGNPDGDPGILALRVEMERCCEVLSRWRRAYKHLVDAVAAAGPRKNAVVVSAKGVLSANTVVTVKAAIDWLHDKTRARFLGCPKSRVNQNSYRHQKIRAPIFHTTGNSGKGNARFPSVTIDLVNKELAELIRRAGKNPGLYKRLKPGGRNSSSIDDEQTEDDVCVRDMDALAWYVPFHSDREHWGVYIPVTGLLKCASLIAPVRFTGCWQDIVDLAMRGLLAHEFIHYAIEYRMSQLEMVMNEPCYVPAHTALSGRFGHVELEEQVANGAFLRCIRWSEIAKRVPGSYQGALSFTKTQYPGYCDGYKSVTRKDLLNTANELMRKIAGYLPKRHGLNSEPSPIDFGGVLQENGKLSAVEGALVLDGSQCPIYLIRDEQILGIPSNAVRVAK